MRANNTEKTIHVQESKHLDLYIILNTEVTYGLDTGRKLMSIRVNSKQDGPGHQATAYVIGYKKRRAMVV